MVRLPEPGMSRSSLKNKQEIEMGGKSKHSWAFLLAVLFFLPSLSGAQPATPVPRGTPGDLWADRILGQAENGIPDSAVGDINFNEASPYCLFNPGSAVVDTAHNILYVQDGGNNRILGLDLNSLPSPYSNPNSGQNQRGYNAFRGFGSAGLFSHKL